MCYTRQVMAVTGNPFRYYYWPKTNFADEISAGVAVLKKQCGSF
jgi:hypothetical protein